MDVESEIVYAFIFITTNYMVYATHPNDTELLLNNDFN